VTWNRGVLSLLTALTVAIGAATTSVTASAKELDTLYARVLRDPANTELNLRFARLAEEQGVLRWALMAYERVTLNDPNNWEAKVGLMRVRRAIQPNYTLVTIDLGTGYESNPLYYLPDGKGAWFGQGLIALNDERNIGGQRWRTSGAVFGQVNARYNDLNYAHAGGETGPIFDLLPGLSFTPMLGGAAAYFDDRFYYAEGSASATFEGTSEGIYRSLRFRAAYRSYDDFFPTQEGWYYDIRARVVVPKVFGDGNLVALSPWVLWSDISGTVTNSLVTEIQPGAYREVGGRIEIFQQLSAWMTVGGSLAVSWRDYSNDFIVDIPGEKRKDTLLIPGAMALFPGFFWKEWDLRFDYRYLNNDSNDPTKSFKDHIVTAAVTKRFDPFRPAPTPGR
jgi:hypothetical protein